MFFVLVLIFFLSYRAGKVNYTTALDMSLYLHREKDYVPWRAAMLSLSYIGARLSMTSYYGLYQVSVQC